MDWLIADSNFYSRLSLKFVRVRLNHILCFFSLFLIQIIAISWLTGWTWVNAFIIDNCARALVNVFYIVTYLWFMFRVAFFRPFYIQADFSIPSYISISNEQEKVERKIWISQKFGTYHCKTKSYYRETNCSPPTQAQLSFNLVTGFTVTCIGHLCLDKPNKVTTYPIRPAQHYRVLYYLKVICDW